MLSNNHTSMPWLVEPNSLQEDGGRIFEVPSNTTIVKPAFNLSQFDSLLQLHSILLRYNNYTQQAKSCDPSESGDLYSYLSHYKDLHGYFAISVCIFGVIANILIMVVLRRKEMHTPVNLMLLALAIADLLIMLEYIPFALHMYIVPKDKYLYWSATFVFFHVHFTQILHTISIQLTLTMAIWRYAALKNSTSSSCTFKRCYQSIAAAYICPLFFCILNYLYFQIRLRSKYLTQGPEPFNEIDGEDIEKLQIFETACLFTGQDCSVKKVDLYIVESSDLVKEYPVLHTIHFWTFSVLIKLIPCVVLTFFMGWMVNTLYKARRHHKMLEQKSALPLSSAVPTTGADSSASSPTKSGGSLIQKQRSKLTSPRRSIRFKIKEENSRKCSNASGTSCTSTDQIEGGGRGGRRFTRNLIRFPSNLRRNSEKSVHQASGKCKRTDRTSKMLIAVLILFLLTEFPQGIMHFLTGWYGPEFLRCKYNPWGEIWDIVALINSAINFILYCFMSKQFRTQFKISFRLNSCSKRKWSCNNNPSTTV